MVSGIGVDIVEIDRLRAFVGRQGEDAVDRLLTDVERCGLRGARGINWATLAGRIAGKEATKKLLGHHGEVARWTEIEILHGLHGEPYVRLSGQTLTAARRRGINGLLITISHEKHTAIAVVVGTAAWQPWETQWIPVTP
jgi:phosphopantetheine--protein transferase-like protein